MTSTGPHEPGAGRRRGATPSASPPEPAGASAAGGSSTAAGTPEAAGPLTRGLIVVGPGASFGVELLRRYGREGFALGVVSRSADTLSRMRDALAGDGLPVVGAVADVTDSPALADAVERVCAEIGGLTVLVYNAKLSIRGAALTVAAETLDQTFAVNVTGALAAVQVAAGLLDDRLAATIMVTAAGPRTEPVAGRFALAVGKAGLTALAEALRPTLAARGIRLRTVVLDGRVSPAGPLRPDEVADHFWQAFVAPRGDVFRLAQVRRDTAVAQLPLEV
ncbi:SDR family NAD(P)-dependent oxidoreductase [Candidatus Frankia alpina]|uniref:SDR family oxidoreductase n=1 Tax=Candidatus Frankia alpina TaxID=2699483 RepID=A0A4S5DMR7_9ACTN|nr:SDR family NAD(P)-dependent oxidoreductase [Candidatus Frankia alpina]THJ58428.1 SDR family oxidoreductase [Candidatus Frankia alpina]